MTHLKEPNRFLKRTVRKNRNME